MTIAPKAERDYANVAKILLIMFTGGFFIYGIGTPLSAFFFYSLLFGLFLFSKNDVFWVALFFIFASAGLGMFQHRWNEWVITISPTVGVSYKSLLPFVLLFKYRVLGKRQIIMRDKLLPYYRILIFYLFFLLGVTLYYGLSMAAVSFMIDYLPSFLFFGILPVLFTFKELASFNRIIFAFVIFQLVFSFIDILTSGMATSFMTFGAGERAITNVLGDDLTRITGGVQLSLYAIIISLSYLIVRNHTFNIAYLWFIIIVALIHILNSATRGWMVATGFLLIMFILVYSGVILRSPRLIMIMFMVAAISYVSLPERIRTNLDASFERFSTMRDVAEGDVTAGGTVSRWDIRGPKVLVRFQESPLFGFGFSQVTPQYFDVHVGNHSLLLIGGIAGLVIVYLTILMIIFYFARRNIDGSGPGFFIFAMALVSIMMIHSTSRNMISYYLPAEVAMLLCIMFNHSNAYLSNNSTLASKNQY
jgi:hypothetical protein